MTMSAASESSSDEYSDSDSEVGEVRRSLRVEETFSSDSSDEEEEDDDVPIAEKIARKEEKGSKFQEGRKERTVTALQKIRERLGKMKEEKSKSTKNKDNVSKRSKHAPTEASSKKEDNRRRTADLNTQGIGISLPTGYRARDPRVSDGLSGHLNIDQFERNFAFVQDIRDKEIEDLRKRIKARQVPGRRGQAMRRRLGIAQQTTTLEDDQAELKRLVQERADLNRGQIERAAKRAVKKKLEQDVAEGRRGAYYVARRERKKLELEAKFEEIRKRGGDAAVDKAVAKRRKKNKSRDAAKLGGFKG